MITPPRSTRTITMSRAALVGLLLFISACASAERAPSSQVIGERVTLVAPALAGAAPVSLEALEGRVVIVDFWASWCGPCKEAFRLYRGLLEKYGERLAVLAVSVDEERALAERFVADHPAPFVWAWDEGALNARRWPVDAMPTSFVVDTSGAVRSVHRGFDAEAERALLEELEALLGPGAPHSAGRAVGPAL